MLRRFLLGMRRLLAPPTPRGGGNGRRPNCQAVVAAMLVFVTLGRPIQAEPPPGELPSVDRCRVTYVDLQGVDARGRPWFLGHCGDPETPGKLVLSWIDSDVLHQRQLEDGYNLQRCGRTFEPRWPWAGSDVLCDADGTVWVVGATRLGAVR